MEETLSKVSNEMFGSESPVRQISVPAAAGLASLEQKLGQSPLFPLTSP